jgi:hypothetical protein
MLAHWGSHLLLYTHDLQIVNNKKKRWPTAKHGDKSVLKAFSTGSIKVSEKCFSNLPQTDETDELCINPTAHISHNTEDNNIKATKLF